MRVFAYAAMSLAAYVMAVARLLRGAGQHRVHKGAKLTGRWGASTGKKLGNRRKTRGIS